MSAREALRAATAAQHERVDSLFSRFDLTSPSGYREFLVAQAAAFLPVERALDVAGTQALVPDWGQRRRAHLLVMDLTALTAVVPEPIGSVDLAGTEEILGAVYVLEGSRLGGAVLKKMVSETLPRTFIGAKGESGSWRKLLTILDASLIGRDSIAAAAESARNVFGLFEAAAGGRCGVRAA